MAAVDKVVGEAEAVAAAVVVAAAVAAAEVWVEEDVGAGAVADKEVEGVNGRKNQTMIGH